MAGARLRHLVVLPGCKGGRAMAQLRRIAWALLALAPVAAAGAAPAARTETRSLAGLAAPGRVITDHWGVAHIQAASARDAFFLQGYAAARDRLWQIDLWRKRGLGRLAASFGPAFVEQDRAARLFLYRGSMAAEWAAYPAEARGWTEAFADGINAYVAEIAAGKRPLPPEFSLTGSAPERWSASDIVRIRSHALVANLGNEVARARSLCLGGAAWEPIRIKIEPPHTPIMPKGLDPCDVPADVLSDYLLATAPVSFDGKTVAATTGPQALAAFNAAVADEGSNNWVIDAAHSATGRPILANDPHRAHGVPSLRTVVHLDAPDLSLIGAGEPALPGIAFGHNGETAWGITIFAIDQEDLYLHSLTSPDSYRFNGQPLAFTRVDEVIEVKGAAPRTVTLTFSHAGPVVWRDARRAFSVRSVWSQPGGSGYFNASWMYRAEGWPDFEAASRHWGAPPLNLVYADRRGDIGWRASGFTPVRANWDGLLPVPGDGSHEWQGLMAADLLPAIKNPARGWFATANEMNLPADFPNDVRRVGFEWSDRSRIDRISQVLAAKPRLDLVDSMALQTDQTSPLALRTIALLDGLAGDTEDQRAAIALLSGWDGEERIDSAAAALFEVWTQRHLRAATVAAAVPQAAQPAFTAPAIGAVVSVLAAPGSLLGPDPAASRRRILLASLASAWSETVQLLGRDPARWRWGDLHLARFAPAVATIANPALRRQLELAPLQVGGSASTPMATSMRGNSFDVAAGASVRLVIDVGDWDNSVFINTPGQSGDPFNAHYRDLFPLWAAGRYAPLLFSRAAVERNAESITSFTPAQ
jgi:penicillin amidase